MLLLIVLFSIAILNGFKNKVVVVNALNNDIKKIYCNATLDDDFAEDRILVVLNDKVSSNSKIYSNSDGCGAITQQGHVIANSTLASGKKYATCLLCKGKAEMGFTPIDSFDNEIEYVTDNKNYILRNGIIVLVDEDVELFFKGNLRFYKRNTDLVW